MDDENEYIVNSLWYEKGEIFNDEGEWSYPIEIPDGSFIWGIKTNASSAQHALNFSFIVREGQDENKFLQTNMNSTYYFKQPEHGWINLELREAREPDEMFPYKVNFTLLTSTRID